MKTRLHSPTPASLRRLAAALRRGELVAIPTETVYGLAANALDAKACRAIFRAKKRPANDPLIVHVLELTQAEELAHFNDTARRLARRFWPGPLTIVLPKKSCVPAVVTSRGPTVAIRSPAHPLARRLLKLSGVPLAAPSANLFGCVSPTTASHVMDGLNGRIPHVLDGGSSDVGVESTVVDLTDPARPRILRPGMITAAQLQNFLGRRVSSVTNAKSGSRARQLAPGMLDRHYSPHTPLEVGRGKPSADSGAAIIFLRKPSGKSPPNVFWLSRHGSLREIAHNLYRVLRQADQGGFRRIWLERPPADSDGLVVAINDRLKRAASP